MKRESDRAFLLRSVNFKESDKIVTLFLERMGKISAMAKGARKSWRRFGGALEPFSLFEVTVVQGKGNLWRLDEATLISPHSDLASDLSQGVTGEVHYVDGGYNIVGIPSPGRMSRDS